MVIRFAIISYVNQPWIWSLTGDAFYMWGSTGYLTAALGFFGCAIASINTVYLILELNHKLFTIDFIQKIRNQRMQRKLENKYLTKFCVRVKFYTRILYPTLIGCAFVPVAAHGITSVISYVTDDVHRSVIPLIISNVMNAIWMIRATAMGLGGNTLIYFIFQYLKYEFRQLNDSLQSYYQKKNSKPLIESMKRHQKITVSVKQMNGIISYIFGFTYISCTPPMNILFFLGFNQGIHPIIRLIYVSVAVQIVLAIFILNFVASSFSATAHKSLDIMYKYLIKGNLSSDSRLKINSFIEKLMGNTIGFYCFDLFALDNYRFYQYISSFVCTYFLIYEFIDFYRTTNLNNN